MPIPKKEYNIWRAKARKRRWNALKESRGSVCEKKDCTNKMFLQFAHITPTKLSGRGRGSELRYYDIKNNPDQYLLLCITHHQELDYGNTDDDPGF